MLNYQFQKYLNSPIFATIFIFFLILFLFLFKLVFYHFLFVVSRQNPFDLRYFLNKLDCIFVIGLLWRENNRPDFVSMGS